MGEKPISCLDSRQLGAHGLPLTDNMCNMPASMFQSVGMRDSKGGEA